MRADVIQLRQQRAADVSTEMRRMPTVARAAMPAAVLVAKPVIKRGL